MGHFGRSDVVHTTEDVQAKVYYFLSFSKLSSYNLISKKLEILYAKNCRFVSIFQKEA